MVIGKKVYGVGGGGEGWWGGLGVGGGGGMIFKWVILWCFGGVLRSIRKKIR